MVAVGVGMNRKVAVVAVVLDKKVVVVVVGGGGVVVSDAVGHLIEW